MKKLLKFVDRKIVAAFLFMVVAFTALNFTWVNGASSRLDRARTDRTAAEIEINELRSRLSDARADGVTSADALLSRVQRLEVLLPFGLDDIGISQIVIASAESSGVVLERFQPAAEPTKKEEDTPEKDPNVVGGLKAYRYDFKVTGPYLAVTKFLNSTVASRSVIVTFDGLYFYASTNADNPSIFADAVTAEGTLLIWTSMEKHLGKSESASTETPSDTEQPADTTPTDGAAPSEGSDQPTDAAPTDGTTPAGDTAGTPEQPADTTPPSGG
jgi:hypothetical protein